MTVFPNELILLARIILSSIEHVMIIVSCLQQHWSQYDVQLVDKNPHSNPHSFLSHCCICSSNYNRSPLNFMHSNSACVTETFDLAHVLLIVWHYRRNLQFKAHLVPCICIHAAIKIDVFLVIISTTSFEV